MPGMESRAPERTGEQERVFAAAEPLPTDLFDLGERLFDLRVHLGRVRLLVVVEIGADLRGDREPGRHRQADAGHFREVRALAAEERLHRAVAVGAAVAEIINVLARLGLALGNDGRRRLDLVHVRARGLGLRRGRGRFLGHGGAARSGKLERPGGIPAWRSSPACPRRACRAAGGGLLALGLDGERGAFGRGVARFGTGSGGAAFRGFGAAAAGRRAGWVLVAMEGRRRNAREMRGG